MGKRSSHAALAIRLAEIGHPGSAAGDQGSAEAEREQSYRRRVRPQSDGQQRLMAAIERHNLTIALGPAGTGKTYLAVSAAVAALEAGEVGRIVLTRPAVEAGESLGYLPGDINDKLAPVSAPAQRCAERTARRQARQAADDRRRHRDRADRLYARAHVEQCLHRDRRGAELHLRADQDAADAAGLAFDDGCHRRPRPERPSRRPFRSGRYRPAARADTRHRGGPARRPRHRPPSARRRHADGVVRPGAPARKRELTPGAAGSLIAVMIGD